MGRRKVYANPESTTAFSAVPCQTPESESRFLARTQHREFDDVLDTRLFGSCDEATLTLGEPGIGGGKQEHLLYPAKQGGAESFRGIEIAWHNFHPRRNLRPGFVGMNGHRAHLCAQSDELAGGFRPVVAGGASKQNHRMGRSRRELTRARKAGCFSPTQTSLRAILRH